MRPVGVGAVDEVVGLVHSRLTVVDLDFPIIEIDPQHVAVGIVCDEHIAFTVEADAVADTAAGQFGEDAARAIRCNFADRALLLIVDGVEIPVSVTAGAFDVCRKTTGLGERAII